VKKARVNNLKSVTGVVAQIYECCSHNAASPWWPSA